MLEQGPTPALTLPVSETRDHILGPRTAPATLVEYGDFECPHCGRAHFILNELMEQMGDHVRLVFRHFPLTQVHPHALAASGAAEAASLQGRFWEMHDWLFHNQKTLADNDLWGGASAIGLDPARFERDRSSDAVLARVRRDVESGIATGEIRGTPTLFIDGVLHAGGYDVEALIEALT